MAYNLPQKLSGNIIALRTAFDWKEGKALDAQAIDALKNYAGFGGIKAILFPEGPIETWESLKASKEDLRIYHPMMGLHELLHNRLSEPEYQQAIDSLKNSVLTAFYTPELIPQVLYDVLKRQDAQPAFLYEPSAGSGVFITEAVKALDGLQRVTAVEKDQLTGMVLQAVCSELKVASKVHVSGLEHTPVTENGQYDLVVSNIPFGNFSVYDPEITDRSLTGKIHNYFFAKGLEKLAEGGLMAFITTDAFLNNYSNKPARQYLFDRADFVSLAVMPDNLMKDTGNTEAPCHLLIVQKNTAKNEASFHEKALIDTITEVNQAGAYQINQFINMYPEIICGDITAGTNQYGQPIQKVWADDIHAIADKLRTILELDFRLNFNLNAFKNAQLSLAIDQAGKNRHFTFLEVPTEKAEGGLMQLGLFDTEVVQQSGNKAAGYITDNDKEKVNAETARIISTIRTTANPGHDSFVLLTAKQKSSNKYVYRLQSNVNEIHFPASWLNAQQLHAQVERLSSELRKFDYLYNYEGDKTLEESFALERGQTVLVNNLKPFYKEGTLLINHNQVGYLSKPDSSLQANFHPLNISVSHHGFFEQYIILRDQYLVLAAKEVNGEDIPQLERDSLNKLYDAFTGRFGQLNTSFNRRLIGNDGAFGFMMLSSLERKDGEQYVKSDILEQAVSRSEEKFRTDNVIEALAHCLNEKGKVDVDFIESLTSLSPDEVIEKLGNHIYLNPETNDWETADHYLSGNVVIKLVGAEAAVKGQPENYEYQRSLEAMMRVQPERIPFELLDFNLGERWIPVSYYNRFATQLFDTETTVSYFSSVDTFKVSVKSQNPKVTQEFAVVPKSGKPTYGNTMLEHALENTSPFYTYEVQDGNGGTRRVPDNDAIQLAHQKIDNIRNGFLDWLQEQSLEDKKQLEELYNNTFNCYVLREFDGSHLTLPGLDLKALEIEDLYSSQRNAVWRIIQNRGALIDHEVGLGKTLTMIVAAHEMKRLGILHKPAILALKANVDAIRDEYRKAYPNAKIIAPSENEFTPEKRMRLFFEIKNNNWDCIILTHDQFGKIPQSPEIQREIFQQELDNIEYDLDTLKSLGGDVSRAMLRGLEIRKNNLEGKLKEVMHRIDHKQDEGINFKEMGIDHLFIDEAHKFKNLTFTTRHNRVAGLGNMEGSQKALNMLFAIRTLQARFDADLCVTFLSGTPISNSLTELYLIFKYLRPREMERQQIQNFDAWAAVFARKTTDFEFSVTNEIIAKERFRHFIKVPELALFYNEITDYKTAKHINLDKPEVDEVLVDIPMTPDQVVFSKKLMEFARTGNAKLIGRPPLSDSEDKGRMLIATNYAKKMAADLRLIDDSYEDHPDNKVNVCARNVAEVYRETQEHRGTQIIFCDIGTPKPNEFNLYDALKEKLTRDFNIPAYQITFIHDWPAGKKRDLFKKMNNGDVRILVGSTEKAGTGLNVQKKIAAMHHLDIPWKPAELEQRNGRGARQGNLLAKLFYNNKVRNFVYAVRQSLDNYKFNLLKNKQTFIAQMKNCELNVRTIDEGSIDEKSGMNFSEYIAVLSGDTTLLEKSKLEKKVAVMESLKKAHFREAARSRYQLDRLYADRQNAQSTISKLEADQKLYKENLRPDKDGSKLNPIQLNGFSSIDPEAIGKYLIDLQKNWKPGQPAHIGSLYGFNLHVEEIQYYTGSVNGIRQYEPGNSFYAHNPETGIKYTYNSGWANADNPKLAARYFLNAIDRVISLKEKYDKELAEMNKEIMMAEQILKKPFEKESELQSMKAELLSLERKIAINIQEKQMEQEQAVNVDAGHSIAEVTIEKPEVTIIPLVPPALAVNLKELKLLPATQIQPRTERKRGIKF